MGKLRKNPKIFFFAFLSLGVLLLGVWGGALGAQFGGGFIGAPLSHIQVPAEPVTSNPLIPSFVVTNTMVATWLVVVFLISVAFLGTRNLKQIPGRFQCLLEVILEFMLNISENVAGQEKARRFFPLVMTIFIFIVTANWMGILPGFATIGRYESAEEVIHHAEELAEETGKHADLDKIKLTVFEGSGSVAVVPFGSVKTSITAEEYEHDGVGSGKRAGLLVPFFRSANTDINTTLAIALVAMIMVHWWGIRFLGTFSHIKKYVNFREGPIGLFVGLLEAVSELARVVSFTFRLFGNIFAGEVLLVAMAFLVPLVGLVPFLGLELFVGLVQAFIFAMLTLVFASTATTSHGGQDHH